MGPEDIAKALGIDYQPGMNWDQMQQAAQKRKNMEAVARSRQAMEDQRRAIFQQHHQVQPQMVQPEAQPMAAPLPRSMPTQQPAQPGPPPEDARFGELGVLKRPDGGISTEISITVTDPRLNGGRPTNIPTLVKGQKNVQDLLNNKDVTREQEQHAIQRAIDRQNNGAWIPHYDTIEEAVKNAELRTASKGKDVPLTDPSKK